jgi:hypothetical protein
VWAGGTCDFSAHGKGKQGSALPFLGHRVTMSSELIQKIFHHPHAAQELNKLHAHSK